MKTTESNIEMIKTFEILACLLLLVPMTGRAQLVEMKSSQRAQSAGDVKGYRFTLQQRPDTVTIRVVNPRGELQTMPVIDLAMDPAEKIEFQLNTTNWIPGEYHIVVEGKHTQSNKRFKIFATRRD